MAARVLHKYGFWPNTGVEDYNDLVRERDAMGGGTGTLTHHHDSVVGASWLFGPGKTRDETNTELDGVCAGGNRLPLTGPERIQFWSVEDKETIRLKTEWIKQIHAGGAFVFDLSQDYRAPLASDPNHDRDNELTKAVVQGRQ